MRHSVPADPLHPAFRARSCCSTRLRWPAALARMPQRQAALEPSTRKCVGMLCGLKSVCRCYFCKLRRLCAIPGGTSHTRPACARAQTNSERHRAATSSASATGAGVRCTRRRRCARKRRRSVSSCRFIVVCCWSVAGCRCARRSQRHLA